MFLLLQVPPFYGPKPVRYTAQFSQAKDHPYKPILVLLWLMIESERHSTANNSVNLANQLGRAIQENNKNDAHSIANTVLALEKEGRLIEVYGKRWRGILLTVAKSLIAE